MMKECCKERLTAVGTVVVNGGSTPAGTTFLCVCGARWRKDWPGRWTQVAASTQAPSDPDLAALADLRERTAKAVEDAAHDDAAVEFAAVVRGVPLLAPVVPTPIPALPSVWDSPPPASPEGPRQWERLVSVAEPGYAAIELHECVHTRPWGPVDYAWRLHSRRLVEWPPKRSA